MCSEASEYPVPCCIGELGPRLHVNQAHPFYHVGHLLGQWNHFEEGKFYPRHSPYQRVQRQHEQESEEACSCALWVASIKQL